MSVADVFNSRAMPIDAWRDFVTGHLPPHFERAAELHGRGQDGRVHTVVGPYSLYALKSDILFKDAQRQVVLYDLYSQTGVSRVPHTGIQHAWRVAQNAREHGYTHMTLYAARRSGGYVWAKAGFEIDAEAMLQKEDDIAKLASGTAQAVSQLEGLVSGETLAVLNRVNDQVQIMKETGRVTPGQERVLWQLADLPGRIDHEAYKLRHPGRSSRFESPLNRSPDISVRGYALLDSKWRAIMRFDDEEPMARFESYALANKP